VTEWGREPSELQTEDRCNEDNKQKRLVKTERVNLSKVMDGEPRLIEISRKDHVDDSNKKD